MTVSTLKTPVRWAAVVLCAAVLATVYALDLTPGSPEPGQG
jgi:hypothetical protein